MRDYKGSTYFVEIIYSEWVHRVIVNEFRTNASAIGLIFISMKRTLYFISSSINLFLGRVLVCL